MAKGDDAAIASTAEWTVISRFLSAAILGLAILPAIAAESVLAEQLDYSRLTYPAYPVDMAIQACKKYLKRSTHIVLAYSPGGSKMCIYGDRELASESRALALKDCNKARSSEERRLSKCRLVMESGKIIDPDFYKSQSRESRLPVNIEIFDGKIGKTSQTTGHLTTGRFLSATSVEARLVTSGGAVLCKGKATFAGPSERFDVICFDEFRFTGPVPKPDGYMMYEGQFVQRVTIKVKHKKSYIVVSPRS